MQKTQREIKDAIIDEVLITGTANIAPADLKIIKSVAAEYVRDIFRRLREHGYDENAEQTKVDLRLLMKALRDYTDIRQLAPEIVNALIRRIEVHSKDK